MVGPRGTILAKYLYHVKYVYRLKKLYTRTYGATVKKRSVKIAVVGPEGCGKTSFVHTNRFGKFNSEPSTGWCHFVDMNYESVWKRQHKVEIWEATGEPEFIPSVFKEKSIIFCFDMSNADSIEKLSGYVESWMKSINIDDLSKVHSWLEVSKRCICIVGMKSDLKRRVSYQKIASFVNAMIPKYGVMLYDLRIQYFETSAKTGKNLMLPIHFILALHDPLKIL